MPPLERVRGPPLIFQQPQPVGAAAIPAVSGGAVTSVALSETKYDAPIDFAAEIVAYAQSAGSLMTWLRYNPCADGRNQHEAVCLAATIDVLLDAGLDASHLDVEIPARRFFCVTWADQHGNAWDICEVAEFPYVTTRLVSPSTAAKLVAATNQFRRLKKDSRGGGGGGGRGGRGRGRGRDRRGGGGGGQAYSSSFSSDSSNSNSKSGAGPKAGAAR